MEYPIIRCMEPEDLLILTGPFLTTAPTELFQKAAQEADVPATVLHNTAEYHRNMIYHASSPEQLYEFNFLMFFQYIKLIQTLFLSHYGIYV